VIQILNTLRNLKILADSNRIKNIPVDFAKNRKSPLCEYLIINPYCGVVSYCTI
jgi:hypothetical protein